MSIKFIFQNRSSQRPDSGYPIIYVLDGNAFFQTFHEAIKIQSVRAEKTGVSPRIIVGIGYPIEGAFSGEERCYDLTPVVISKDAPLKPDGKPWPKTGEHIISLLLLKKN